MNDQPRRILLSQASGHPMVEDRFLVQQENCSEWDLTRTNQLDTAEDFPAVSPAGYENTGFAHLKFEPDWEPTLGQPYLWVSWRGLGSVLEYRDEPIHRFLQARQSRDTISEKEPHPATLDAQTLGVIVLKPDAQAKGLGNEIRERVMDQDLSIVKTVESRQLNYEDVEQIWTPPYHWRVPREPGEWWHATAAYMCEAPVTAHLVQGEDVSQKLREVKTELRLEHGCNPHELQERPTHVRVRSLIHCTDRTEELVRNASLFWNPAVLRQIIEGASCA